MGSREDRSTAELRRWERLQQVLGDALERPQDERVPWLRQACRDDPLLLRDALELLSEDAAATAEGFLSPAEAGPALLAAVVQGDGVEDRWPTETEGEPGEDRGDTLHASLASAGGADAQADAQAETVVAGPGELAAHWGDAKRPRWTVPDLGQTELAGRYRLHSPLGTGGAGSVYLARDRISGQEVAVKLLRGSGPHWLKTYRRETLALRLLRLPGVVRLLDDGVSPSGIPFLVMERCQGSAFPGRASQEALLDAQGEARWLALRGPVRRLLEALERIHAAGLVHRDLKPSNVLVDAEGQVVILDLGIAVDAPLQPPPGAGAETVTPPKPQRLACTPAYAAPELLRGLPAGQAADLYAVGVMLYELLSGEPPHELDGGIGFLSARAKQRPRSLAELEPQLQPQIAAAVDRLLAPDPAERHGSVRELLAALGEDALDEELRARVQLGEDEAGAGPEALERLFSGPERVLHLKSDGARALYERTGGRPAEVRATLANWIRAGLAWFAADGVGVHVPREALDRLLQTPWVSWPSDRTLDLAEDAPAAEVYAAICGGQLESLPQTAVGLVEEALGRGQLRWAEALCREALACARLTGQHPGRLLPARVSVAFLSGTFEALERALVDLGRVASLVGSGSETGLGAGSGSGVGVEALEHMRTLVRCAAWAAESPANAARAVEALQALPEFADPALERWRHSALLVAAQPLPAQRQLLLAAALDWVGRQEDDPVVVSAGHGWRGWEEYYQGEFRASAEAQALCAALTPHASSRVAAWLGAGAAWLEAGEPERAREQFERGLEQARRYRLSDSEAAAERLIRSVRYRAGDDLEVDQELVAALRHLALRQRGTALLTEAAVAWRRGEAEVCRELAREAGRGFASAGGQAGGQAGGADSDDPGRDRQPGELLADALALACRADLSASGAGSGSGLNEIDAEEAAALAAAIPACRLPRIAVQAAALLRLVGVEAPLAPTTQAELEAGTLMWQARAEVLDRQECLQLLV